MFKMLASCLLLLAVSNCLNAETVEGFYFADQDWEIACDNTRTCRAAGYSPEGQPSTGYLKGVSVLLTRRAGPNQPVIAEFVLAEPEITEGRYFEGFFDVTSESDQEPEPFWLMIDDQDLGNMVHNRANRWFLTQQQITPLLNALKNKQTITFGDPEQSYTLSNAGAEAVMLKMDQFQGRLDTPGALIQTGTRPESEVLPRIEAPLIILPTREDQGGAIALSEQQQQALKTRLAVTLPKDEQCDFQGNIQLEPFYDGKVLRVHCWQADYDEGYGIWLIDKDDKPTLVTTSALELWSSSIVLAHKQRALGDCWSVERKYWNGSEYLTSEAYTTGMCREMAGGGIWQLFTTVAEVKFDIDLED